MSSEKIWETSIWVGDKEEKLTFFSKNLGEIRRKVFEWVINNEVSFLSNSSSNDEISRRYSYAKATKEKPLKPGTDLFDEEREVTEGWVGVGGQRSWSTYDHFLKIEDLASDLANFKTKIKKGPDWKEIEIVENKIPLYLIKAVKRIKDEDELNDHLQGGWYLLSIEGKSEFNTSEYVIGHTEEEQYYKNE